MSQQQLVDLVDAATGAGTASAIIEALRECEPDVLLQFLHGALDGQDAPDAVATGTPASPGAASGVIATDTDQAMAAADSGQAVILVRPETTPDDVLGMRASRGILTARGGLTSHAAVVARGWGIPAVVGLAELSIDGDTITIGAQTFAAGDMITIDGHTGAVYAGQMAVNITDAPPQVDQLLGWADQVITSAGVAVRVNADTPDDTTQGLRMGAVGIGLCRTEHMFLAPDRLPVMRRFILATDRDTEQAALDELRDLQTRDFADLLNALDGAP
jgi:pyruvate,orthophosphate dikinase